MFPFLRHIKSHYIALHESKTLQRVLVQLDTDLNSNPSSQHPVVTWSLTKSTVTQGERGRGTEKKKEEK